MILNLIESKQNSFIQSIIYYLDMSAIWNLLNPIRCGGTNLKLMSSGRELFGTVIKSGKINKTVTVKFIIDKFQF